VDYCVSVLHRSGLRWQAWRRFSDFVQLHDELTRDFSREDVATLPVPPRRSWLPSFTQTMEFHEQRQHELQAYFTAVVGQPEFVRHAAVQDLLGVQPPDQPAGVRVVPRSEEYELEVRPGSDCGRDARPIDEYRIEIVHLETGSTHSFSRDVGITGHHTQRARIGRLLPGKHQFTVAAVNLAGYSSPISVSIDTAKLMAARAAAAALEEAGVRDVSGGSADSTLETLPKRAQDNPQQQQQQHFLQDSVLGRAIQRGKEFNHGPRSEHAQESQTALRMSPSPLRQHSPQRALQQSSRRRSECEAVPREEHPWHQRSAKSRLSSRTYTGFAAADGYPSSLRGEFGAAVASAPVRGIVEASRPIPADGVAARASIASDSAARRTIASDTAAAAAAAAGAAAAAAAAAEAAMQATRLAEMGHREFVQSPEARSELHSRSAEACGRMSRGHSAAAAAAASRVGLGGGASAQPSRHSLGGPRAARPPPPARAPPESRGASAAVGPGSGAADDKDDDDSVCIICMAEPRSHAFIPCGHRCVCAGCSAGILAAERKASAACPICRAPAGGAIQIFM